MKVFVDTHIFIDYFLDRKDRFKPLGEFAFQFFKKAVECRYFVIICQPVIDELCSALSKNEKAVWEDVLYDLVKAKKIELITFSREQMKEASAISAERNVPKYDALFAIIARDNNAIIVSRDKHHHENLSDLVRVSRPEELG